MTDLMEIIKGRRSIRKYETRDVPDEMLEQILESVRWAPSWTNCQCWEVVVIRDPAIKTQLQATFPPKGNPAYKAIVQAPVLLALTTTIEGLDWLCMKCIWRTPDTGSDHTYP